jgi:hypothetical protein
MMTSIRFSTRQVAQLLTVTPISIALLAAMAACGDVAPDDNPEIGGSEQALTLAPIATPTAKPVAPVCLAPADVSDIDARRSLAVTDQAILQSGRFELSRVMDQLITTAGASITKEALFAQWFNFFNADPNQGGSNEIPLPRCSDGGQTINGFPIQCPRSEGQFGSEANSPFKTGASETFVPIGLFNRLDLAPTDGSHCGEYRIVYGKQGGPGRDLIIFEGVLPNPEPACGITACRRVARFWAKLSRVTNVAKRTKMLERFYFKGIKGDGLSFRPVVHAEHYGPLGGQIRVNLFRNGGELWQLRDFQTELSDLSPTGIIIKPESVKGNPFAELFDGNSGQPLAGEFQDHFLTQLRSLAADDVNAIGMSTPLQFNAGQSTEQVPFSTPGVIDNRYGTHINNDPAYAQEIDAALTGSGLDHNDIAQRATAMSCAGCHQLSAGQSLGNGLTWPLSLGFVHIHESLTESGPDGQRHVISAALSDEFLPARAVALVRYLNATACSALVCEEMPVAIDGDGPSGQPTGAAADDEDDEPKPNLGGTKFTH